MSQSLVLAIAVAYLLMLFAIAWAVERGSKRLGRLSGSSLVYTLSLAVYCSSWTFNGGVGRAALNGFDFLPIYLGPTLAFCLGPIVIRRILRISKANQITSIADLIGARFGRSAGIAALVTVIAVIGLVPYIALQLKSVSNGFAVLTAQNAGSTSLLFDGALWAAVILTVFAMLFGSRSIHPGEHHPGMVVAIAAESVLKLIALTMIGLFVVYGLFHGFYHGVTDSPDAADNLQPRLHTVLLPEGAASVGGPLSAAGIDGLVEVTGLRRAGAASFAPGPEQWLQAGDVLVLLGTPENLVLAERQLLGGGAGRQGLV